MPARLRFFFSFKKVVRFPPFQPFLAGGAAIMAIAGILFFHETASWQRVVGVLFAIIGLFLLRK